MTTHGLPGGEPGFGIELESDGRHAACLRDAREREPGDDRRDQDEELLHAASFRFVTVAGSGAPAAPDGDGRCSEGRVRVLRASPSGRYGNESPGAPISTGLNVCVWPASEAVPDLVRPRAGAGKTTSAW